MSGDTAVTSDPFAETGLLPQFSPAEIAAGAAELGAAGYTRLDAAIAPDAATALAAHLDSELTWSTSLRQNGTAWDASPEQCAAIGEERLRAMAMAGAESAKFHFLFDIVRVSTDPAERDARALPVDRLAAAWSSQPALAGWNALLGRDDIAHLMVMATRYRPGHFLTAHNDGTDEGRIAAFVLSLSDGWKPDWGGQLQLLNEDGEVERALVPKFNSLTIFKVPRLHAVSMVVPFAPAARLSIAGWLRTSP